MEHELVEADPRLTNCESDCYGIPHNSFALKRLFWEEAFLVALKVLWPVSALHEQANM